MGVTGLLSGIAILALSATGGMAGPAVGSATPEVLTVEVSAPTVTAFDVKSVAEPVALQITVTGSHQITSWTVTVDDGPRISDTGLVEEFNQSSGTGLVMHRGVNVLPIGTTKSALVLKNAGKHRVTVRVTDATGAKANAETILKVIGRAKLTAKGVSKPRRPGGRYLVWGTGSAEMAGRTVKVHFKPTGGKFRLIGTTRVSKKTGYWKTRARGLGSGTIKVKAKSPYIAATWAKLTVGTKAIKTTAPDLTTRPERP